MLRRTPLRLVALCGALLYGHAAFAALVTWTAEARLPEGYDVIEYPLGSLAPNDPVRISFLIDSNAHPITPPTDFGFVLYQPLSFDLQVGPYHMDSSNADAILGVEGQDYFQFSIHPRAGIPSPDLEIRQVAFAFFGLVPPEPDRRVPTAVPTTLDVAFDMDARTSQGYQFVSFTDREFRVDVRSVQVPIPVLGTLFFGSTLALIGAVSDRRNRRIQGQPSNVIELPAT